MRLTASGSSSIRGLTSSSASAYRPSCHSASGTRLFWYQEARPSSSQLGLCPSTFSFHGSSRWNHSWASCHLARTESSSAAGPSRITTWLDRPSASSGGMSLSGYQSREVLPGVLSMSMPTNANERSRGPNRHSIQILKLPGRELMVVLLNRNYPYQAAWTQVTHHPRREPS